MTHASAGPFRIPTHFVSLFAALVAFGCVDDDHRLGGSTNEDTATGSVPGDNLGSAGNPGTGGTTGGGGEDGQPDPTGGAANVPSNCRIIFPSAPTFYPGDADSPCPATALTGPEQRCDRSLLGTRCVYANQSIPDAAEMWTCSLFGTLDGEETPDSYSGWEGPLWVSCARPETSCRPPEGVPQPVENADGCQLSSANQCNVGFDETAQDALDHVMTSILSDCALAAELGCRTSRLSVSFEAGCAADFVVEPESLVPCISNALANSANWRPSCALGLGCAFTEVGGCL
ncbi:MAG: hypothetical protein JW751_26835 [Polyangiaceae bacterium]|nr:hypothetical protein [Polyangiaceae bacterium]